MNIDFKKAQKKLGYTFSDLSLLAAALTHSSFANENATTSYERLEFLGDAVIGLVVADDLYKGKEKSEGALTKVKQQYVSRDPLCAAFLRTGLEEYVRVGKGIKDGISDDIREDLFEAVVGAVYLDGGLDAAKKVINKYLNRMPNVDYISKLKEYSEKNGQSLKYSFREEESQGAKVFYCTARLGSLISEECKGPRKRSAQRLAAKDLIAKL